MDQKPDMNQLLKLAQSPAGQQLLTLLQQQGGKDLEKAVKTAASGNYAQAKALLSGLLHTPEAQNLLKQLEEQT